MKEAVKLIMLGTGTPNLDPLRSGPCVAITVGEQAYLFDFGPGVARRASQAYKMGLTALKPSNINRAFVTHLHSDHTAGYADLIFSTWVAGRKEPLRVWGPAGLEKMTNHILAAYELDIKERTCGLEREEQQGAMVIAQEITEGVVYQDEHLTVEAFLTPHGGLTAYSYKLYSADKTIFISGDTGPDGATLRHGTGCDILVHEVYAADGLYEREPKWQKYHSTVHTSARELGKIAAMVQPKLLVLYHQLYMFDIEGDDPAIVEKMAVREGEIMAEIRENYGGAVVFSKDLDVFA